VSSVNSHIPHVKINIFITDMQVFATMNKAYMKVFDSGVYPVGAIQKKSVLVAETNNLLGSNLRRSQGATTRNRC
jgi:hypothetical protein